MFEDANLHNEHTVRNVGGPEPSQTITALDEMINFGLDRYTGEHNLVYNCLQILLGWSF